MRCCASRCCAAASSRGGYLRCSVVVVVVVAVKLFHSENVFVAIEFLNSLVDVCFLALHRVTLSKTTACFKKNIVLF